MDKLISLDDLNSELDKIVTEVGPEYCYDRPASGNCLYVHGRGTEQERPGCIIGLVYFRLTGENIPEELELSPADRLPIFADDDARRLAQFIQDKQDVLETWAYSVTEGRQDLERGFSDDSDF